MKRFILAAVAMLGAAPSLAQPAQQPAEPPAAAPDYTQDSAWVCLPGRADTCGTPLPTVALNANGYGSPGRSSIAAGPPVDCFYVYPTVSRDPGLTSDLNAGPTEEIGATAVQFARFAEVCRPFAPLYRQMTLASLPRAFAGEDLTSHFEIAYGDVLAAFRQFLASRNQNRPFVLIGHSQGTVHLQRLIREEIDGRPLAARMVSALLIGFNTEVPQGRDVGGTFAATPLCTRPGQTGCIVSYVSYRADAPPPADARFGRAVTPGMTVACTNPATLAGGAAPLDSYWFGLSPAQQGAQPITWSSAGAPPAPFLRTEGFVTGECVQDGQAGYFAIRTNADPADARTDRIPGDVYILGQLVPGWGLHLVDVNVALGDLIRLVRHQGEAWVAAHGGERG